MRRLLIFCLLLLSASCLSAQKTGTVARKKKVLKVPLIRQENPMWCWAASTQMILDYMGDSVTQCEQVSDVLPEEDCCALLSSKEQLSKPEKKARRKCKRKGNWPIFDKLGFDADLTDTTTALSWDELKQEIENNRPVAFAWNWKGGGSHMMVVRGYADPHWVYINDPWPPQGDFTKAGGEHRIITYKEYVTGSNHTHNRDFYNIRAKEKKVKGKITQK